MGLTHRKRHLSDCLYISGDQQLCAGTEKYISVSDSGDRDILCFLCFLQVLVGIIYPDTFLDPEYSGIYETFPGVARLSFFRSGCSGGADGQ